MLLQWDTFRNITFSSSANLYKKLNISFTETVQRKYKRRQNLLRTSVDQSLDVSCDSVQIGVKIYNIVKIYSGTFHFFTPVILKLVLRGSKWSTVLVQHKDSGKIYIFLPFNLLIAVHGSISHCGGKWP